MKPTGATKLIVLILTALVLSVVSASAQVKLPPNQAATIKWDHPGDPVNPSPQEVVQFRLILDGAVVKTWTSSEISKSSTPTNGLYAYAATYTAGFPRGSHVLTLQAFNDFGMATSDPVNLSVGQPPVAPTGTTITLVMVINSK